MGKYSESLTCKCGTSISIDTYHYAGGVNDKENITLVCNNCGTSIETVIENIEQARIHGATKAP